MATTTSAALSRLRTTAAVILGLIALQTLMGIGVLTGYHGMAEPHGWLGYLTFLASLLAAVFAWQAKKADPARGSLFGHSLGMFVLAFLQIGLAEMAHGSGPLKWVHVVLGLLFFGASVGLFTSTNRKR